MTLAGAWVWAKFKRRRRKDPAELERLRRLDVNRRGRISTGRIVELIETEDGRPAPRLVVYTYEVAGVTYEAAQDVSGLAAGGQYLPGQIASVKYDPKQPANSIIACEGWSGIIA